jgi:hypothetical protein
MGSRRPALLAVLALAFTLRAWHVEWGLPATYQPDEVGAAEQVRRLLVDPGRLEAYAHPPLQRLLAAAGLAAARRVGGPDRPDAAAATLALRWVSVTAGTAGVLAIYLLAGALVAPPAAISATLLQAVLPLAVVSAMDGVPDTLLSTLFALGLWAALRASERPTLARLATLGGLVGLSVAAKYNGVFLLLAAVAALLRARRHGPVPRGASVAFLVGLAAGILAGFPWLPWEWRTLGSALRFEATHLFVEGHRGLAVSGRDAAFTYHLRRTLLPAMGPVLLAASLAGLLVLARRRDGRGWVLLAAFLPYFVAAEWIYLVPPRPERYALPLAGPLLVSAMACLEALVERLGGSRPVLRLAGAGVLAAYPLMFLARMLPGLVPDTRDAMGAWMAEHLPAGTRVLVEPPLAYYPDLSRTALELVPYAPAFGDEPPQADYALLSSLANDRYLEHPNAAPAATAFYRERLAAPPLHEVSRSSASYLFHNPTLRLYALRPLATSPASH